MPFSNPKAREAFFATQAKNNAGGGLKAPFQGNSAPPMPTFNAGMKSSIAKQPSFQLGSIPTKPRFQQLTSMFKKGM